MRIYTLAKRGLNALGGLEMIYKTNISLDEIEGSKIEDLEAQVRKDLQSPLGLYEYAHVMIVTDSKDDTMSVVLREQHEKLGEYFRAKIEVDEAL